MVTTEEQPDIQTPQEETDVSAEPASKLSTLKTGISAYYYGLRESKLKFGLTVLFILLFGISIYLYVHRDQGPTPRQELETALSQLDVRGNVTAQQEAKVLAKKLIQLDYRDSQFPGGPEYIMGITTFREANMKYGVQKDRMYSLAAHYLIAADRRTLDPVYRPEWAFALGSSLYGTGQVTKSRKLLEEAAETFEYGKVDATFRLIDLYFDIKTPELLEKSLELNTKLLKTESLTPVQTEQAYLLLAQILQALGRIDEAKKTYEEYDRLSGKSSGNLGIKVLQAQTLMEGNRYEEALVLLRPVAEERRLDQTFPRQASYLQGVCAQKLGKVDAAIFYFERTAMKYEDSHEGLAANVYLADLLRKEGRSEEAYLAYQRALRLKQRPENYRNQWLSIDEFRKLILNAWNEWTEVGDFENPIALAKLMHPLFPKFQALELTANARQQWAEHFEREFLTLTTGEKTNRQEELRKLWQESGQAYANLAAALKTTSRYPEALWVSAEHLYKGHDFQGSLNQLTRFINTRPKLRLPMAYYQRGKLLMDMGRFDEALEHFTRVVRNYPTDTSAFDARLWIGRCHLEKNQIGLAEKAWRDILKSEVLTPSAQEWRQAQFELGRLLFHSASTLKSKVDNPNNTDEPDVKRQNMLQAFAKWEQAIRLLDEYLQREETLNNNRTNPGTVPQILDPQISEARFLLARSLQMSAMLPRKKLKAAETEIARNELRRTIRELLTRARDELRTLQRSLLLQNDGERLNELGKRLLRDCYFHIAHTYFDLENYEEAIIAFSSAAHRYPEDPQVLLAYLQMADCNVNLNRPEDARIIIEQAKVILNRLPDDVFQSDRTNWTREEWKSWLERWRQLHLTSVSNEPSPTMP